MSDTTSRGWIGVDLDGTIAYYDRWRGEMHIGAPIEPMVERVKAWLAEGREVRIVTARASTHGRSAAQVLQNKDRIAEWCQRHIGKALVATAQKDMWMAELWDDRCHPVELNTGADLAAPVVCTRCFGVGTIIRETYVDGKLTRARVPCPNGCKSPAPAPDVSALRNALYSAYWKGSADSLVTRATDESAKESVEELLTLLRSEPKEEKQTLREALDKADDAFEAFEAFVTGGFPDEEDRKYVREGGRWMRHLLLPLLRSKPKDNEHTCHDCTEWGSGNCVEGSLCPDFVLRSEPKEESHE